MNLSPVSLPLLLLAILLLLPPAAVFANSDANNLFRQANEAYSRGDYGPAISGYRQITKTAGYSSSVLFNLANSYAQSGDIGRAVLNYERALRLAPSDADIAGNLELLRKEHGLFAKEPTVIERFFQLQNLNQWTALVLVALVSLSIFLIIAMQYRWPKRLTITVGTGCLLLLCLGAIGAVFQLQHCNSSVIIATDIRLFLSPFESSSSIGTIQEGRRVYPSKIHRSFTYVTDVTGRKGWLPSSAIEPVYKEPEHPPKDDR